MKKSLYFVICFIVMFGYCGEVSAKACSSNSCISEQTLQPPIANYVNTCSGITSPDNTCGSETNTSNGQQTKKTIYTDKDDGYKYDDCRYSCYKKRKVLILIDDSNSMKEGGKINKVKDAVNEIAKHMTKDADKLRVCYFQKGDNDDGCLRLNGDSWIDPSQAQDLVKKITKKGENTNFVSAYERANDFFTHSSREYIPILFFFTDGYPTENNENALGYLSSARYAFQAANRLENMIHQVTSDYTNAENIYKDSNARIVTVGVGVNDNYVRFILNPTSDNANSLASSGNSEEVKLRDMVINGNRNQNEAVAGVCSFPDEGGVVGPSSVTSEANYSGTTITGYTHRVTFSGLSGYASSKKDICFIIGTNDSLKFRCSTANKNKCSGSGTGFSDLTLGNDKDHGDYDKFEINNGKWVYRLHWSFFKRRKNAYYRFVWNTGTNAGSKYAGLGNGYTNNAVFNYGKVFASFLGDDAVDQLKRALDTQDSPLRWDLSPNLSYFKNETVITQPHSNCLGKAVTISGNFMIDGVGNVKSIKVPIVITEDAKFNAGTLENGINVRAGRGFAFTGSYVENNIYWYYSYFDNYSNYTPSDPIIYYNDNNNKTTLPKLKKLNGSSYSIDELDKLVWNKIKEEIITVDNTSNVVKVVKNAFKTVNSNNKDDVEAVMPLFVESDFSHCSNPVYNSDSTKSADAKKCVVKYNISQPEAYINRLTREFVYQKSTTDETYKNNELYLSECSSGSSGCNSNKYYIPFDQPKIDNLLIKINGNFSSVSGLELNFDNKCKISVDNGTVKTDPDQVKYRSIDVNDPFPRAENIYDKISSNWRDWYCSSGAGNICSVNGQNKARLSKSYSKIFYSISLDSNVISEINKDTIEKNSYTQFVKGTNKDDGLPSGFSSNGVSAFVNKYNSVKVNSNSFCSVGEFYTTGSKKCDQW